MSTPAMVPCPDCGTPARATGQSFCDSCGAFLRWTAPAAPAAPPAPDAAPAAPAAPASAPPTSAPSPEPARRSIAPDAPTPPAGTPVFVPGTRPAGPATPPARPDAMTVPTPAVPNEPRSTPGAREARDPQDTTPVPETRAASASDAARALLVPVAEASAPGPAPETPGTVLPGRPEASRPRVRSAGPVEETGAPCPACGTPNHQHRNFCRSCATPLTPRRQDNATGPYAGQRPALHRDRKRWIARALIAVAVVGVVVGGIIGGPPAARAVQDHFAKRVAVHPTDWKASHSDPKHGPQLAGDSYSNTWWGTGYAGDAEGTYLEATFGQPTDLLALLITPGTSKRTGQQSEQARPQEFDLIVTDTSGKQHLSHRSINDGGVQQINVRVRDAASVRLILRSAFGAAKDKQVAIAELEFFARSKNNNN
ncbi:NADase-type glycan-binding domain-containing protein [Streptomyces sp. NPDC007172]|uniref:NADase-type glycan-binding domain-containing protein n=1 Tax=Streptomyces sp. NPDC007172 TaxID=3364776 RepID=UPI0036B04F39